MSKVIYIISCVAAMPLVAAIGLGIHNSPSIQHMATYGQINRPEVAAYVPITFEEPRIIQLADVNVIGHIAKVMPIAEKQMGCGDWRKTKIQRGWVRECNYE